MYDFQSKTPQLFSLQNWLRLAFIFSVLQINRLVFLYFFNHINIVSSFFLANQFCKYVSSTNPTRNFPKHAQSSCL